MNRPLHRKLRRCSWLTGVTLSSALVSCAVTSPVVVPSGGSQKPTSGGMSVEQFLETSDPDAVITRSRHDVIVATVVAAAQGTPTNAAPPVVEIKLREVLSGDAARKPARALWEPVPHDIDWVGSSADARIAEWAARPLPGPDAGSTWILVGSLARTGGPEWIFRAQPQGRFEYSAQRRAWALRALAARKPR